MQDQEVTQDHRVFKVSKGFVVISDQKVTQAVKDLREILVLRDQKDQRDQSVLPAHRETSDRRDPEVFRDQLDQSVQLDLWDLRV